MFLCIGENGSNGCGDIRGAQASHGDLIEQRLKEMMVAPVDHEHV